VTTKDVILPLVINFQRINDLKVREVNPDSEWKAVD